MATVKRSLFSLGEFLESPQVAKSALTVRKKASVFSQGEPSDSVFYIRSGAVKLSAFNKAGKEAILTIVRMGDFFGEGCLVGQSVRTTSAIAVLPSTLLAIRRTEMTRLLHTNQDFADRFLIHSLLRIMRVEEDAADQMFNAVEKRLARLLLMLVHYTPAPQAQPKITHELLAEMVGTPRTYVTAYMSKWKKMGYIEHEDGYLRANPSLLSVLLRD